MEELRSPEKSELLEKIVPLATKLKALGAELESREEGSKHSYFRQAQPEETSTLKEIIRQICSLLDTCGASKKAIASIFGVNAATLKCWTGQGSALPQRHILKNIVIPRLNDRKLLEGFLSRYLS